MNKKSLRESFKGFLAKVKPMTWRQRIDFVWTYYKDIVFVVGVLMLIPIALMTSLFGKKETLFGGMVVNVDVRQIGVTYLTDDLFAKMGGDPRKESVDLQASAFDSNSLDAVTNYNTAMSTIGYIEGGILDYLIADKYALEWYILQEIYMDLSLVFTPEELAEFGDRLIYAQPEGADTRTPIAIDISQTVFAKDCLNSGEEPVYFSFVGADENAKEYRAFWDYLMAWEQTEYHKQMNPQ